MLLALLSFCFDSFKNVIYRVDVIYKTYMYKELGTSSNYYFHEGFLDMRIVQANDFLTK